ncbi:PH domain-containing protein [Maribacter aestuarii]|uniref:PH domain-containing protein n=1 Tax=Maribacter aestuarii TaxID=1130723 RepID=UPI00248B9970|nr:PH domain-containing protein [Maribacter aestuarii]
MKKYKSGISYGLLAAIIVIIIAPIIFLPFNILVIIINLFVLIFIFHLFWNTYYIIDGKDLIIKSGFVVDKKLAIDLIRKISETSSIMSAPAASFDRLEINYGKYSSIIISPKDKSNFIKDILKINPAIDINKKGFKL